MTENFELPPQWVLTRYSPDEFAPHVFVVKGFQPDEYLVSKVDFAEINLYAVPLNAALPAHGPAQSLIAKTPEELYKALLALPEKVVFGREISTELREVKSCPLTFGHSSQIITPQLVFHSYRDFLETAEMLKENPDNAVLAYDFIVKHPMFWYVKERTGRNGKTFRVLVTDEGFKQVFYTADVKKTKKGELRSIIHLETGARNYHDYNLDVSSTSFDKAYLKLAMKIMEHYDFHGGFIDKTKKEPNDNFG